MPSACNNKRKAVCGPSACNKKKQPGVTSKGLEYDRLRILLCLASYMVPGMKTIPSFFLFVVPGTRYHTHAIQQQKHLVPGIKI